MLFLQGTSAPKAFVGLRAAPAQRRMQVRHECSSAMGRSRIGNPDRKADRTPHLFRGSRPLLLPGHRAEGSCRFALPVSVVWRSRMPSASRPRSRATAALLHVSPARRPETGGRRARSVTPCIQPRVLPRTLTRAQRAALCSYIYGIGPTTARSIMSETVRASPRVHAPISAAGSTAQAEPSSDVELAASSSSGRAALAWKRCPDSVRYCPPVLTESWTFFVLASALAEDREQAHSRAFRGGAHHSP